MSNNNQPGDDKPQSLEIANNIKRVLSSFLDEKSAAIRPVPMTLAFLDNTTYNFEPKLDNTINSGIYAVMAFSKRERLLGLEVGEHSKQHARKRIGSRESQIRGAKVFETKQWGQLPKDEWKSRQEAKANLANPADHKDLVGIHDSDEDGKWTDEHGVQHSRWVRRQNTSRPSNPSHRNCVDLVDHYRIISIPAELQGIESKFAETALVKHFNESSYADYLWNDTNLLNPVWGRFGADKDVVLRARSVASLWSNARDEHLPAGYTLEEMMVRFAEVRDDPQPGDLCGYGEPPTGDGLKIRIVDVDKDAEEKHQRADKRKRSKPKAVKKMEVDLELRAKAMELEANPTHHDDDQAMGSTARLSASTTTTTVGDLADGADGVRSAVIALNSEKLQAALAKQEQLQVKLLEAQTQLVKLQQQHAAEQLHFLERQRNLSAQLLDAQAKLAHNINNINNILGANR